MRRTPASPCRHKVIKRSEPRVGGSVSECANCGHGFGRWQENNLDNVIKLYALYGAVVFNHELGVCARASDYVTDEPRKRARPRLRLLGARR